MIEPAMDATTILAVVLIALQMADGVTTVIALTREGLAEGNPIAARLMLHIGVLRAVVLLKLLAIALTIAVLTVPAFASVRLPIIAVATVLYLWVVADNLRLLIRRRRK